MLAELFLVQDSEHNRFLGEDDRSFERDYLQGIAGSVKRALLPCKIPDMRICAKSRLIEIQLDL